MYLEYIEQQIIIYGGIIILVFRLIGNCINILMFTSIRTYRQESCMLYFLKASISDLICLLILLNLRVLSIDSNIDPNHTSLIRCKIRLFCIPTFSQTVLII